MLQPDVDQTREKSTRRKHHRIALKDQTHLSFDTSDATADYYHVIDRLLKQREVRLRFNATANRGAIHHAIRLRPRRPNSRTF